MKLLPAFCGALLLAYALAPAAAFAQAIGTVVEVPDSWVDWAFTSMQLIAGGAITVLVSLLPGWARLAVKVSRIDQLADKAIGSALAKLQGDLRGPDGRVNIDVKNKLVADMLVYAREEAPSLVSREKLDSLRNKFAARLELWLRNAAATPKA